MTKISTKFNHFVIGIHKLFSHYIWISFITISTNENLSFSSTSGFHAQTLMAILKVKLLETFFSSCVWLKRRALFNFSESLKPKQPGNIKILCPD